MPLCCGIIAGLYLHPSVASGIAMASVALTALVISGAASRNRIYNPLFGTAFIFTMFISGLLMFNIERSALSELSSEPSLISGILADYPEKKPKTYMLPVEMQQVITGSGRKKVKGSIVLYLREDTLPGKPRPGDRITFRCTPQPITNRGNPYEFDYRFFMESRGYRHFSFCRDEDVVSLTRNNHLKLRHRALIIRKRIVSVYEEKGIKGEQLALVSAITLGEKSLLDQEQKQNFIDAGVMHIMAVSGLHAVILSLFVFNLLFFLKGRLGALRIILAVAFLWSFAFVTGLTPSVLRATLMFSFVQAGKLMNRKAHDINSVLASAFFLIIMRPSVIFDAGFLLSYSAVLFIVGFYRNFCNLITIRFKPVDLLWQSAAVTIVAQAGTLPLTIMLFNRFPVWFLLTNILIVPLSSLVIIAGCLVPMTYPIEGLSDLLAWLLDKLVWLTGYLTTTAASLPLSSIGNIGLSMPETVLLFLSIAVSFIYLLNRPRISPLFPLALILALSLSGTIGVMRTSGIRRVIIYNTPGYVTTGIQNGRTLHLFTGSSSVPREVMRHSAAEGLRVIRDRFNGSEMLIRSGSKTIKVNDSLLVRVRDEGAKVFPL